MGRRKKEVIEEVAVKPSGWIEGSMPKPVSSLPTAPDPKPTPKVAADPEVEPEIVEKIEKKEKKSNGCFEVPKYNGHSFMEALRIIKVDSAFLNRKKIAEANGMDNYLGLGKDNKELLELLMAGNLKMPK